MVTIPWIITNIVHLNEMTTLPLLQGRKKKNKIILLITKDTHVPQNLHKNKYNTISNYWTPTHSKLYRKHRLNKFRCDHASERSTPGTSVMRKSEEYILEDYAT